MDLICALGLADKYGLPILPWDGGWRVIILDSRLDPLMRSYDAKFQKAWIESGHAGSWVSFYGKTVPEAISKAAEWLQRHPASMKEQEVIRKHDSEKRMPKDKYID